jgi:hypothetical protein
MNTSTVCSSATVSARDRCLNSTCKQEVVSDGLLPQRSSATVCKPELYLLYYHIGQGRQLCYKLFLVQQRAFINQAGPASLSSRNRVDTSAYYSASRRKHKCHLSRNSLLLEATSITACAPERAYGKASSRPTHFRTDATMCSMIASVSCSSRGRP